MKRQNSKQIYVRYTDGNQTKERGVNGNSASIFWNEIFSEKSQLRAPLKVTLREFGWTACHYQCPSENFKGINFGLGHRQAKLAMAFRMSPGLRGDSLV